MTFAATPSPPEPTPVGGGVDPLTEAGDVVWYVRPPSGGQFGPATTDIMRTWLAEGRVTADALVWREGWRDWQEAGGVFSQLSAGQVMPGLDAIISESVAMPIARHPAKHPARPRSTQTFVIGTLVITVLVLLAILLAVLLYKP